MKQTKQFLRPLLMAIVMLVGMLVPQGAWAEEYPVITGGTHTIDIAAYRDGYTEFSHYTTIFKYVAPKGGTLTVYTEGNGDTASAFFDEDKKTLTYDDDSGNSRNFKFSYKVVKDHTYYIGVCSSEDFTNYTLVIDESDLCDHEIVNHVCTICGKHQSRIVSVPAGVTVTDDDGNPITSEDYIWEGRTVNISVNASEVTAPIYIGLDATTAEGSRLNIRRNNSFVMPGSDVTLNYMAIPSEPLCFEAKEDGAKIGFSSIVSDYILYYSTDKENWTSFNYDDTHYLPTLANAGDKIYLIGNVTSKNRDDNNTKIAIEDAKVAASGKLSSILGGATIIYDFGCYEMFYYNEKLISAPDMSDITEIEKQGCGRMFLGCTSLTTAPAMSSLTTIEDSGCFQMFGDCSSLTTAPAMSRLTAIGFLGCEAMFYDCSQLTGFEFNTVPNVENYAFSDFGTDNITLNLSDDSYVYVGENPNFPTVTSVTAPCTLNLTGSVVENHANLILNHGTAIDDEEVAATCTTTGLTEGSHCSLCNMPFVAQVEIEALGHDYHVQRDENEKPVFVWSEDYTSATLQVVCSHDAEHTANVEVTGEDITSEDTTPATCTTAGVRTYTAKASYAGVEYTGTKEVEIPATGHAYHVQQDENEKPVFVWSEGYTTATLQVVCSHNAEHTANVEVTLGEGITWVDTPATCTAVGVRTYTATATYEGETYTGTAIEAIEPIAEHTLDEHNVCTECGHGFIFFEKERSYDIEPNNRYAFSNSEGSVEYIGNTTFNEWMYAFEFSGLVTEIGDRAFTSREALTAIYLPEVTTIGEDAFNGCGLRDNVSLPKATTIGQAAFLGCGFQTLSLPEATTIGYGAFWSCDNLSSIELPKATTIENDAFRECSNLNSITVACAADLSGAKIREGATITRVHDFSSKTLTAEPVADGLYAYACDRGCGAHSDDHIVKGDGNGNTFALTANTVGETTTYTAANVTLEDGKAFSTPVEFTTSNVTMARTFTQSVGDAVVPATIMLPFSIEANKLATVNGDVVTGTKFYGFTSLTKNAETGKWEANMDRVTGTIQAHTPYMIVLTEGTAIGFGSNEVTFPKTPESNNDTQQEDWTFVATNEAKVWTDADFANGEVYYGFAAGNETTPEGKFVKVGAGASIDPLRAYIMKTPAAGPANAPTRAMTASQVPSTISVRLNEAAVTGIGTLNIETGEFTFDGWYDLQGRRISEPVKNGISINNGKKIMVK